MILIMIESQWGSGMDKIIIEGGRRLKGSVEISGSKNASLPCLFATLLTDEPCTLNNVPELNDIDTTCKLLEHLGKKVERKDHSIQVTSRKPLKTEAPYELVKRMRASVLVLGPLLARFGKASCSMPGGCAIGVRPINIHLSSFQALGAETEFSQGMVRLKSNGLKGKKIVLDFPSVGATENALMACVLAKGQTILENVAKEPEIEDCAKFLNAMGAEIKGAGTSKIVVQGKDFLHGATHQVIPDRIETATYLIASAATKGEVELSHTYPKHLKVIINHLIKAGIKIQIKEDKLNREYATIFCKVQKAIKPVYIKTGPYPKFPTDVQAQWMSLMSLADGNSLIQETIFENRFVHAAELGRMGAKIKIKGNQAKVSGSGRLSGAEVMVSDLRAGAALVIAALAAKGKSVIQRVYHLDRGYEKLEQKLSRLGARIYRVHG